MKALLLTLGLVALSALVAVARWGPGEAKEIDGVIAAPVFAGTRLVVTQDEPVQGLALVFNGTNVAFESGYTQANGYWHYTAYVPAVLMNFSTTDTVSNTIEVTHVSADDGLVRSSNIFTWYP